jgi:chaperonin GroEL
MKKNITFGSEALTQVAKGVEILAKTVGSTLGPGGRNVIFENLGFPMVTKDGVTVASQIELKDKLQNIGAQMVKQVAKKTCDDAGDGTTSSVVLANAIVQEGLKVLSTGVNPIDVQRGILKAIEAVVEYIEKNIKMDVEEDVIKIQQIAKVSANWDDELSEVIANSIIEVGINGAIRLDENRGYQTKYTIVDGLQFDRGYVTSHFINNQAKQVCEMDNPYVMFYAGELRDPEALLPILKEAKRDKHNLFIVAEKFEEDVLRQLAMSKTRSGVSVCAIKAPHYKDMCYDSLHDISVLMGGTCIDPLNPECIKLEDVRLKHCGRCEKVTCSLQRTSFVGFGNYSNVEQREAWSARLVNRIKEIEELSKDETADKLPRENAKLRLKQINAKAAIISIGASSEIEYQEKLDRADDALRATRCAMTEGVVPGAGYSYLKSTKCEGLTKLLNSSNVGEQVGAKIIQKVLTVPFKKLLTNAGMEDEIGGIMSKVINGNKGFNLKTKKFEDLIESGVLDPWMVTKSALRNAGSVAGMLLTSEAIVSDDEEMKTVDVSEKLPTL